jgi:hypothetical protein
LLEVVDELKRALNAIGEDALVDPGHTRSYGEAKKNGFFPIALSDDGEGVAKVFENVVTEC